MQYRLVIGWQWETGTQKLQRLIPRSKKNALLSSRPCKLNVLSIQSRLLSTHHFIPSTSHCSPLKLHHFLWIVGEQLLLSFFSNKKYFHSQIGLYYISDMQLFASNKILIIASDNCIEKSSCGPLRNSWQQITACRTLHSFQSGLFKLWGFHFYVCGYLIYQDDEYVKINY